jgi:hypothetical protein
MKRCCTSYLNPADEPMKQGFGSFTGRLTRQEIWCGVEIKIVWMDSNYLTSDANNALFVQKPVRFIDERLGYNT